METLLAAHKQAPLDGIALFLHGAGVAHGYDDLEGEIIRAVRAVADRSRELGGKK